MNRKHLTRSMAVVIAVGALLTTAACSGNSSSSPSGSANGTPIEIGMIVDVTGPISFATTPTGAKAAVASINAAGGVNGHPLDLFVCDSGGNSTTAADCGQQMVSKQVAAVIRPSSIVADSFIPILEAAKIPMIAPQVSTPAGFSSPETFALADSPPIYYPGFARMLADQGSSNIAMVSAEGAAFASIFQLPPLGVKNYSRPINFNNVTVPLTAADMAPYAQAVNNTNPDGVIAAVPDQQAISLTQLLKSSNPAQKIVVFGTDAANVISNITSTLGTVQGLYTLNYYNAGGSEPVAQEYRTQTAALGASADQAVNDYAMQAAYAAVLVFAEVSGGMSSDITGANVTTALNQANNVTINGFAPAINFTTPVPQAGGARVFTACVQEATYSGTTKKALGGFINAFTGAACS
ncbi:ABC transporter substrate-binding protein [Microbacterium sp. X-17]|uniref:ABC transporter substrate-binding protein n=1 Tax=Microbacterium sp. X-17 TaxID=3144404 RepID=UPI0031F499C6